MRRSSGLYALCLLLSACSIPEGPRPETASALDEGSLKQLQDYREAVLADLPPAPDIVGLDGIADADGRYEFVWTWIRDAPFCQNQVGDPFAALVERARKTNIVIISEDHGAPRHRWFIGEALKRLKGEGYSIYAAETFREKALHAGGASVLANIGLYTNEPMFGRTVKIAKNQGYELVAYEQTAEQRATAPRPPAPVSQQIEARERAQAENLMQAIFNDRPDAKVVIHVGVSHVNEERVGSSNTAWMAAWLKEATGRDPLTIAQSFCRSSTDSLVMTTDRAEPTGPFPPAAVDLFIGYPRMQSQDGRPTWRREIGDRDVPVPTAFLGLNEPVLVEARQVGQRLDTVPMDRLRLAPGQRLPLLLPPGRYRVDAFTRSGQLNSIPVVLNVRS